MRKTDYINEKLNEFKQYIKDKKVAVIGVGISNTPLIKYLINLGVDVTAFDKQTPDRLGQIYSELKDIGVHFSLGDGYLESLTGYELIFKTPGMRHDIPELIKARKEKASITSEMEVFLDLCPAQVFGITGSDGKTTTTTLIYKMLLQEGYKCWLGGNIGTPLLSKTDQIMPEDKVMLELSSFQLQTISKSVDIAVITNITPNHLDIHKSMEEYVDAKKNIYRYQKPGDTLVVNYDNQLTREIGKEVSGNCIYFSRVSDIEGLIVKDNKIKVTMGNNTIDILNTDEILLPGAHNIENYLAAVAAVHKMVGIESIKHVARTFKGVEHRIELVRELNGVKFYNDSIASSPARTIAGLNSFKQKVILIAGGYDKKIPYDVMGEAIIDNVKMLVVMGKTGSKIRDAYRDECSKRRMKPEMPVVEVQSLEEAVKISYNRSIEGDIIILSPASASFDMFKNFEERGNTFKHIVNCL